MLTADWITLGVAVVVAILGLILGFGKTLKIFTSGIFGVIISVVVCYFLYGIVINWAFTQDLMAKIVEGLQNANNGFCDFLIKIRMDIIAICVGMFIIVQIVRVIIVAIIKNISESNNGFVITVNKILGLVLMLAIAAMLALIAFQIISWVGGSTATDFAEKLQGSTFKLDEVFLNNPLNKMFNGANA
jgi:hypothetical protein